MLYEPVGFRAVHGLQRGALLRERGYEDMDYDLLAQLEEESK